MTRLSPRHLLAASAIGTIMLLSSPAQARECLLDTNNDGTATAGVDTDGGALSSQTQDTACGVAAVATSTGSTADTQDTDGATAFGALALAVGPDTVAMGNDAIAGFRAEGGAVTLVRGATAVGASSYAGGDGTVAVGDGARARLTRSLAVGQGADAQSENSTAFGAGATAYGTDALAVGDTAGSYGNGSTAFGGDALAAGEGATAFGFGTYAGVRAFAIGSTSKAFGVDSMAVGTGARALTDQTVAIGTNATASSLDATAVGLSSSAYGNRALSIGGRAYAEGEGAIAIGGLSQAAFLNSVAIGYLARSLRANQMMFGTISNTYTMPGLPTAASNSAQAGDLFYVTVDSSGNLGYLTTPIAGAAASGTSGSAQTTTAAAGTVLAPLNLSQPPNSPTGGLAVHEEVAIATPIKTPSDGGGVSSTDEHLVPDDKTTANVPSASRRANSSSSSTTRVSGDAPPLLAVSDAQFGALSGRVNSLEQRLDQFDLRMTGLEGGIAASMAMGSAIIVPDSTFSLSMNVAAYGGEQGFAASAIGRLKEDIYVSASVSGNTGDNRVGAQMGVAVGF